MAFRSRRPLKAFRIADARHPPFDGGGAARWGGRWNSPGRPVIYGALSYAGALLEVLAHVGAAPLPRTLRCIEIAARGAVSVEEFAPEDAPDWAAPDLVASRAYGDAWLAQARSVALIVPSVVAQPYERNVAINPRHRDFARLVAGAPVAVFWDARLEARRPAP